jgi:cold shock CspA family protein
MGDVVEYRSRDGYEIGVVDHLDLPAGFGYVRSGSRRYIFVLGVAIRHSDAGRLRVGSRVRFRVSGRGRVDSLEPVASDADVAYAEIDRPRLNLSKVRAGIDSQNDDVDKPSTGPGKNGGPS